MTVPDRGATTLGFELEIAESAVTDGCLFRDGDACNTTVSVPVGQVFHFSEGFFQAQWSTLSSSQRTYFASNNVRTEVSLNGTMLDVAKPPITVEGDVASKLVTFQFPDNWTGTHTIVVTYTDVAADYSMTITATVVFAAATAQAPSVSAG